MPCEAHSGQGLADLMPISVSRPTSSPSPSGASRTAGRQPSNFSEWQLLAVLHRANLLQYFDDFIAQGGDDINQFMTCDEHEFLEIMSVVGMASKPLHVRRFQRTLTEFSKDPDAFNLLAIQQIGVPPIPAYGVSSPSSAPPNPAAALQFLLSSQGLAAASLAVAATLPSTSPSITHDRSSPRGTSQQLPQSQSSASRSSNSTESVHDFTTTATTSASVGATANVLTGDFLTSLVGGPPGLSASPYSSHDTLNSTPTTAIASLFSSSNHSCSTILHQPSSSPSGSNADQCCDFEQLGSGCTTETPVLTEAQIARLAQCSSRLIEQMPQLEPKLIQNKKKISRELLDVMQLPHGTPQRLQEYRKYSAIYGRFDAKRKPDKPLTLHEVSVNEAAAQLCLRQPALLTRRDELFPFARQVVKDAGYNYVKGLKKNDSELRKRLAMPPDCYASETSQSPQSSVSAGSPAPDDYVADSGSESALAARDDNGGSASKRRREESPSEQHLNDAAREVLTSALFPDKWNSLKRPSDCLNDDDS